jgi:hypothetical protein
LWDFNGLKALQIENHPPPNFCRANPAESPRALPS